MICDGVARPQSSGSELKAASGCGDGIDSSYELFRGMFGTQGVKRHFGRGRVHVSAMLDDSNEFSVQLNIVCWNRGHSSCRPQNKGEIFSRTQVQAFIYITGGVSGTPRTGGDGSLSLVHLTHTKKKARAVQPSTQCIPSQAKPCDSCIAAPFSWAFGLSGRFLPRGLSGTDRSK